MYTDMNGLMLKKHGDLENCLNMWRDEVISFQCLSFFAYDDLLAALGGLVGGIEIPRSPKQLHTTTILLQLLWMCTYLNFHLGVVGA